MQQAAAETLFRQYINTSEHARGRLDILKNAYEDQRVNVDGNFDPAFGAALQTIEDEIASHVRTIEGEITDSIVLPSAQSLPFHLHRLPPITAPLGEPRILALVCRGVNEAEQEVRSYELTAGSHIASISGDILTVHTSQHAHIGKHTLGIRVSTSLGNMDAMSAVVGIGEPIAGEGDLEVILSSGSFPGPLAISTGGLPGATLPGDPVFQWRLQGEREWHDSGTRRTGLPCGIYNFELRFVDGYVRPLSAFVTVTAGTQVGPVAGGEFRLRLLTLPGRVYTVCECVDLGAGVWDEIQTLSGTGDEVWVVIPHPPAEGDAFYRVNVKLEDN